MESLKDKIVCITGASSGIGAACAEEFAKHGCVLLLVARRIDRLETLARELSTEHGVRVRTMKLDVRNRNDVEREFSDLHISKQRFVFEGMI